MSSSDPHLQALARGENKVMGSTCPYTIIRAPYIRDDEGGWWLDSVVARTQDVILAVLGLVGGKAARARSEAAASSGRQRRQQAARAERAGTATGGKRRSGGGQRRQHGNDLFQRWHGSI